jgi:hypothetical protein
MEITDLPFIKDVKVPGQRGTQRCYWSVTPSGNYGADNRTGEEYAALFLAYASNQRRASLLVSIAHAMRPDHDGITVGFWEHVGRAACFGRAPVELVRERHRQEDEADKRHEAQQRKERSARARHAALAGVAKRRSRAATLVLEAAE